MAILSHTKTGNLRCCDRLSFYDKSGQWLDGFNESSIKINGHGIWVTQAQKIVGKSESNEYFAAGLSSDCLYISGCLKDESKSTGDIDIEFVYPKYELGFKVQQKDLYMITYEGEEVDGEEVGTLDTFINANNYTENMATKAGGGAYGTWNISIRGSAASLSSTLGVNKGGTGNVSMHSGSMLVSNGSGSAIGTFPNLKTYSENMNIISSSTASHRFQVINSNNDAKLGTNTNAGIYNDKNAKWLIAIRPNGTVSVNTSSDRRKKVYIEDMPENEAKVLLNVPIRNFIFKEDIGYNNLEQNGVFAQDLRELLKKNNIGNRPYLQWEYNDNDRDDVYYDINAPEKNDMTYSVSYNHIVPALIKGWQMQNKEIEELEKKLAILRIKKINGLSS